MCSGPWESRAATGVGRAGNSAAGAWISRNLSAAGESAGAREVCGSREAASRGSSKPAKPRRGWGRGGGSRVGSGRGLELATDWTRGSGRGGAGAGAQTLRPPGGGPGRRQVTAGNLGQRVTQPREGPKLRAREVCGDSGWGSRAGSGEGRPRRREAERKEGSCGSGRPCPRRGSGREAPPGGGDRAGRGAAAGAGRRDPASSPLLAAPARRTQTLFCSSPRRPVMGLGREATLSAA